MIQLNTLIKMIIIQFIKSQNLSIRMDPQPENATLQPKQEQEKDSQKKKEKQKIIAPELLSALFLEKQTSAKIIAEIKEVIKFIPYNNIKRSIKNFLREDDKRVEVSLSLIHITITKVNKQKLPFSLVDAYLMNLENQKKKAKRFIDIEALKELQVDIPQRSLPYYCDLFQINIPENRVQDLVKKLIDKNYLQSCCKLIKITGKSLKYTDMLIDTAIQNQDPKVASYIVDLGFGAKQYPDIHENLLLDEMGYFHRKKGWHYCEQVFLDHPKVLGMAVGRLLGQKKKVNEAISICYRHPQVIEYLKFPSLMKKQINQLRYSGKIIPNPLQSQNFLPSNPTMYFSFSEFGIDEKDVLFVDPKYPRINDFMEDIISSDEIGIDTESIVARTKLNSEMSVLALIQVSTLNKVYIFDGLDCQNSIILEYISKYFDDPGKKVIGHTIKEDFKYTIKAFGYNKSPKCQVIDVKDQFSELFPKEKVGLASICEKILGKPICKEYTLTNWQRRPLNMNQLHYAAMDAFIVLKINEKLNSLMQEKKKQND